MTNHVYCDRCGCEMRNYNFMLSSLNEYESGFMGRGLCNKCRDEFWTWFKNK